VLGDGHGLQTLLGADDADHGRACADGHVEVQRPTLRLLQLGGAQRLAQRHRRVQRPVRPVGIDGQQARPVETVHQSPAPVHHRHQPRQHLIDEAEHLPRAQAPGDLVEGAHGAVEHRGLHAGLILQMHVDHAGLLQQPEHPIRDEAGIPLAGEADFAITKFHVPGHGVEYPRDLSHLVPAFFRSLHAQPSVADLLHPLFQRAQRMERNRDHGGEQRRQHQQHDQVHCRQLPGSLRHGVIQRLAGVAGLDHAHHLAALTGNGGEQNGPVSQFVPEGGTAGLSALRRGVKLLGHVGGIAVLHRHADVVLLADQGNQFAVLHLIEPEIVGVIDLLRLLAVGGIERPVARQHVERRAKLIEVNAVEGRVRFCFLHVAGVQRGGLLTGQQIEPFILAVHQFLFKDAGHQRVHAQQAENQNGQKGRQQLGDDGHLALGEQQESPPQQPEQGGCRPHRREAQQRPQDDVPRSGGEMIQRRHAGFLIDSQRSPTVHGGGVGAAGAEAHRAHLLRRIGRLVRKGDERGQGGPGEIHLIDRPVGSGCIDHVAAVVGKEHQRPVALPGGETAQGRGAGCHHPDAALRRGIGHGAGLPHIEVGESHADVIGKGGQFLQLSAGDRLHQAGGGLLSGIVCLKAGQHAAADLHIQIGVLLRVGDGQFPYRHQPAAVKIAAAHRLRQNEVAGNIRLPLQNVDVGAVQRQVVVGEVSPALSGALPDLAQQGAGAVRLEKAEVVLSLIQTVDRIAGGQRGEQMLHRHGGPPPAAEGGSGQRQAHKDDQQSLRLFR